MATNPKAVRDFRFPEHKRNFINYFEDLILLNAFLYVNLTNTITCDISILIAKKAATTTTPTRDARLHAWILFIFILFLLLVLRHSRIQIHILYSICCCCCCCCVCLICFIFSSAIRHAFVCALQSPFLSFSLFLSAYAQICVVNNTFGAMMVNAVCVWYA